MIEGRMMMDMEGKEREWRKGEPYLENF